MQLLLIVEQLQIRSRARSRCRTSSSAKEAFYPTSRGYLEENGAKFFVGNELHQHCRRSPSIRAINRAPKRHHTSIDE
jgi:hypothetical protein